MLDAALEFALVDHARHDGEHYLGGPNPNEREREVRLRAEAELLADYVESHVEVEPGMPEHMRPLAAMSEIVAAVSYLDATLDALRERCGGS